MYTGVYGSGLGRDRRVTITAVLGSDRGSLPPDQLPGTVWLPDCTLPRSLLSLELPVSCELVCALAG